MNIEHEKLIQILKKPTRTEINYILFMINKLGSLPTKYWSKSDRKFYIEKINKDLDYTIMSLPLTDLLPRFNWTKEEYFKEYNNV